ncbi:unnamed protein product [Aphanomyces euteiches]
MDDDLQKFIHSVESSAKKILKDHSKRVHDEAARERVEKNRPVEEKTSISRDELKSKYGHAALILPAPKDKPPDTATTSLAPLVKPSPRSSHHVNQPDSPSSPTTLPNLATKRHKQELKERAASKLVQSPLFKGLSSSKSSPGVFKSALAQLNAVDDLRTLGLGGDKPGPAHHRHEHNVERRMCNACWAEPIKPTRCEHQYRAAPDAVAIELQGAMSWSIDDLHYKYRAEAEREAAWSASIQLQATDAPVVPVLERHPLYALFMHTVDADNTYVKNVSRAKNQTKQFVLDVNRVWLTNLDHFNALLANPQATLNQRRSKGLRGRHDLGAIRQGYSQIQSVSTSCALQHAIQETRSFSTEGAALVEPAPPPVKIRSPLDDIEAQGTPLSILACGRIDFRGKVPGTVVLASHVGLWWCHEEWTRPTAMYLRDAKISSTNAILALVVLALDSPVKAPTVFAWTPGSVCAPHELDIVLPGQWIVPRLCVSRFGVLPTVVSPLDDYLPSAICIPNGCSDHMPDFAEVNPINFRQWLRWTTVLPNFDVDAKAYGLVRGYPNQTGLTGRFSWHSDEAVVAHDLIRPRLEADFAILAYNRMVRGGNDPNMYTLNMRHETIDKLSTSGLHVYLAAQEKIKEEERLQAQLAEIETKLAAGRLALDAKRAERRRLEAEAQVWQEKRAKQLEGSLAMPESTIQEWQDRISRSHVVREWNEWEERELDESGVLFYRHINPELTRAVQWTPPEGWACENESTLPPTISPPMASDTSSSKASTPRELDNSIDAMAKALVENEMFVKMLEEKLGLVKNVHGKKPSKSQPQDENSSSDEEDVSDDDDTVAGRVLGILSNDDTTQDTNTATVKRLTRLELAHESRQVNPGEGWKRLKATRLPKTFAKKVYSTAIAGPTASFINQSNMPLILGLIDPGKMATHEQPDPVPDFREHFVPSLESEMAAMKKVLAATAKKAKKPTIVEVFQDALPDEDEEQDDKAEVTEADRIAKAVLYTRNNNVKELENMLDEGVNINARDENGNTLFILACQQGNKNMCKFLMRRRSDMDSQNFRGNTGLHYCYEYKWTDLATYLKDKGAKDDIPNEEGLMCYEGISAANLQQL